MTFIKIVVALIWGSISAQLLLQSVMSLIITVMFLLALAFSNVKRANNFTGLGASFFQVILFALLFYGGNWLSSMFIDYESWNTISVVSLVSFVVTIILMLPQVSGKLLLMKKCAWVPYFFEVSNTVPPNDRVAFAKRYKEVA